MKTKLMQVLLIVVGILLVAQQSSKAGIYHIFKASAVMPIQIEGWDTKHPPNQILVKKTLGSNDLVNLALGRSLATKVNNETEVLALAYDISNPAANKLIVYNKLTGGVVATIGNTLQLPAGTVQTDKMSSDSEKGSGVAVVTFLATSQGTPSQNGIAGTTTVYGAAQGSWTPTDNGPKFALKATALFGPMKVRITDPKTNVTTYYDGIVVQGMFQTTGVAIVHHHFLP